MVVDITCHMSSDPAAKVVVPSPIVVPLSPAAFHRWATQFLEAARVLPPTPDFSPVPLLLLSRAIELELKARHLITKNQNAVKKEFGHDLVKSYNALPREQQILRTEEMDVLTKCSKSYNVPNKYFDFWSPAAALRGFSMFPNQAELLRITEKLVAFGSSMPDLSV
ncbi:MAG TPA: hypothetical protein VNN10_15950 [Dehalococcoidia bacterium]|nr:hypothetical protein [Dehalococcoidia bacterium]